MKILVTGGTVFVSRFFAEYFADRGHEVLVLNRGTWDQVKNVKLIKGDRHALGDFLKPYWFDAVIDVNAYDEKDICDLLKSLGEFDRYIMVSSSAVYPETLVQPFKEEQKLGRNHFWGEYGTKKIAAENCLLKNVPNAYIVRPPYLYGEYNNLYRESFVFDCAERDRAFYVPKDGKMKLQFFHVEDLCRFVELLIEKSPERHIFNVGNKCTADICEWVKLCYNAAGKKYEFRFVANNTEQRNYFPFYDYEYILDVEEQCKIMPDTMPLEKGLERAYEWYRTTVKKENYIRIKPYIEYIDKCLLLP